MTTDNAVAANRAVSQGLQNDLLKVLERQLQRGERLNIKSACEAVGCSRNVYYSNPDLKMAVSKMAEAAQLRSDQGAQASSLVRESDLRADNARLSELLQLRDIQLAKALQKLGVHRGDAVYDAIAPYEMQRRLIEDDGAAGKLIAAQLSNTTLREELVQIGAELELSQGRLKRSEQRVRELEKDQ